MHDQAQSGESSPFTSGFSSAVPPFRPSPQMFEELQSRLRELLANSPAADIEVINTELALSDLDAVDGRADPGGRSGLHKRSSQP